MNEAPPNGGSAAVVAGLRQRIAALGGLPGRTGGRPSPRTAPPAPRSPLHPEFVEEVVGDGVTWVRRVRVNLGPFLERAGAAAPVTPGDLLRLCRIHGADHPDPDYDASELAVLDIETLGLRGSGVLAFLVGIGRPEGRWLRVDQVLLADPGAEAALLGAVLARLASPHVLITFNGRTFDLPVLRARCIVNRVDGAPLEGRVHADLLAPVRRLFRDRLGACTLRQAEMGLLGLDRGEDVPGAEAPARYRAWLRGAGAALLDGVVRHNQVDLCSTMVLAARLCAHVGGSLVAPVHPADRYALAVHLERTGVADAVDDHLRAGYSTGAHPWSRRAGQRLALRLRRSAASQAQDEAERILRDLWSRDPLDLRSARTLAVHLERGRRAGEALAVTLAALAVCERLGEWRLQRMRGAPSGGWRADWERRHRRLVRRCGSPAIGQPPLPLAG